MLIFVFWYSIFWEVIIKWVFGVSNIIFWMNVGMFFWVVVFFDNSCKGKSINISNRLNWGIEWVMVVIKIFILEMVKSWSVIVIINSYILLLMGIFNVFCIILYIDIKVIVYIIRLVVVIFDSIILLFDIGIVSRCLMVFCFFFWISVVLDKIMVIMVIVLINFIIELN